ncbi:MAG TPA: hemolysin, partial [Porphyromonadaceae bacterium]|nr:hemolysin [Porphyromonadaceae bacterium]
MPAISDAVLCVFLLVLIVVNAIISGSEFAFFSINQKLIDDSQEVTATQKTTLTRLLSKPEKLLATIVISYNLLNIAIAAIAIYLLNRLPYFSGTPLQGLVPEVIIIVCGIVLFVEILPKLYASHNPLKYIGSAIPVVVLMNAVIGPLSTLLVRTTNLFNRSTIQRKHEISMDNLSKALEITSNDTIHEQEKDMLEGIIRFKDKTVNDIFISRIDMVALDSRTPFSEVIKFIVEAGFSRIPVYDENPDNIKGILYVKDLLAYLDKDDSYHWLSLIRPAYFVPRTKRIDDLLEEFRANKN